MNNRLVTGLGFSKGWAALALKNPPPLLPRCFMDSRLATGPLGISCVLPSRVVALAGPFKVWITPIGTMMIVRINASGRSTLTIARMKST